MRQQAPRDPVTLSFDGEPVVASRGEPVAAALVAAGKLVLSRSAKFHRPRGAACFRGACEGCLARVNDEPNVMTCLVPAEEGLRVQTQNTLGSREVDLLQATDWFFPEGINHHELFAGVPGVQQLMQIFARRIVGLGKLPKEAVPPRPSSRREADVVVVGGGPSGMAIAGELAARGRSVEVIDDALALGGGARALGADDSVAWRTIREAFERARGRGDVVARCSTTVGGVYDDDLLVVGQGGAELVRARTVILAPGAHDGVLAFEGNDLPGVMSARAAGWLLSYGVLLGERVAVVVPEGGGPFGEAYARAVRASGAASEVIVVHGTPVRAHGRSSARGVVVRTSRGDREIAADAVLIDAPRAPAYELCVQAGAEVRHEPRGFVVCTDRGRIREGVWAVGEVVGTPFDPAAIADEAAKVAARIQG